MAVNSTKLSSNILLTQIYQEDGKSKTKRITFKNVKIDALDADVYEIADMIANILTNGADGILRQDTNMLSFAE